MSQNVVLVTVDSIRADHCGFMGYEGATTPELSEMAETGTVFEDAIAPGPSTPESMSAVHTGRFLKEYYGGDDEVIVHRRENVRQHLRQHPTIAEVLSDGGYRTIGFSPNPFTARYFGFDKGFDHYQDFLESGSRGLSAVHRGLFERFISGTVELSPLRLGLNWVRKEEVFKSWEQYYDEILEAVEGGDEPFFLWVFLLDTHLPYLVSKSRRDGVSWLDMMRYNLRLYTSGGPEFTEAERRDLVSLYDATIRRVDEFVGRLRDDLAAHDPAIVFHGDHGEAFGEHGTYGHEPYVYEENVHVPYLVWNGGGVAARRPGPTSLRTIPATVAEVAGVDHPFPTGRSPADFVLSNPIGERTALRGDRLKYIHNSRPDEREELYDLAGDPGERQNRADAAADLEAACDALLTSRLSQESEGLALANAASQLVEGGNV